MGLWAEGVLNDDQEHAIAEEESVFLVACPGSGKTRTLTYKVASELAKLDSHRRFVAAITYTHRAADEIEERVTGLGVGTEQLWIGTIHAFCLEWILKPYGVYHPELKNGFQVINSHESEAILKRLCGTRSSPRVTTFDCGYFFTDSAMELGCRAPSKLPNVRAVLSDYFAETRAQRQVDFEHILKYAYELIRDNRVISRVLANIFSFIAIDEYQDTKQIQYAILASIIRAGAGETRTMIVGDPNQSIFTSLGGFAMPAKDFQALISVPLREMSLSRNYRSSGRIVGYFGNYNVQGTTIVAASPDVSHPSELTFDNRTSKEDLETEIARLIRHSVVDLGIAPSEICVVAPWWIHLAHLTRRLVALMPEYEFDGPGLVPFSRDVDNFWFKMARISLTEASPRMFLTRLRWAADILNDLGLAGVDTSRISSRSFLRESNSVVVEESDGLAYLASYYDALFARLGIRYSLYRSLQDQHAAFFASSRERIDRLSSDGAPYLSDVALFRRVFRPRAGITVSTIHGVKGAEFDTVIAFALLEGMVPHFSDADQVDGAKKLMYVIASRARRNLHLIAERGRAASWNRPDHDTTVPLRRLAYSYDK
ncbi:UvrD-helicase domain-containing protein [Frigoribacterium sp. MCBA15_019]|uniref:UvrD-helicase domain-containing protein n=1 Tax=Frigoribacterium sp. MCBA15_019 TaxID=1898745 RepID=UPI0008DDDAAD|nr:ATP-dependent helicase [Frigoribacterium sp. MCBA15_019]OII23897.1 ATP-dependent DNA helicase [Frigoribacterium sp. MCBA15_019]